tara:strand:- start:89 stop:196 length:108 start_codon:yes stop_codon:yes gene_type:complete
MPDRTAQMRRGRIHTEKKIATLNPLRLLEEVGGRR